MKSCALTLCQRQNSKSDTYMRKGFVIAAASSGSGKTTASLGLMRAFRRRGLNVQPFKCGPDYIDTHFHTEASRNVSVNLDSFMSSECHVRELFNRYAKESDVAVVEGVMGMFDGYSSMMGSSADIARLLNLPVILIVNAASVAYSVAATIYGFKNFVPGIHIAGVIFNRVASESHYSFLREACRDAGVECLGYIKRDNSLTVPSRHLGLTLSESPAMNSFINAAADAVEENVNIERILELTQTDLNMAYAEKIVSQNGKTIAVANDEAFNFIYRANIDRLKDDGFRVAYFSPIHDARLPKADFVYLPGGYPELYAAELSANKEMIESVRAEAEAGGKIWAECGGMIYLCQSIDDIPLCGILPLKCTMEGAKLSLGYRMVDFGDTSFHGHEFHYSHIVNPDALPSVAIQTNVKGKMVATSVYRHKNTLASYTHLYWAEQGTENLLRLLER